jgi:uncharacterized protein YuzE
MEGSILHETSFDYSKYNYDKLTHGKIKSQPTAPTSAIDWDDMQYRYDSVRDVYRISFIRTSESEVTKIVPVTTNTKAALDDQDRIRFIEFESASKTFGCHLLDFAASVDDWPPCFLNWQYGEREDVLWIFLVAPNERRARFSTNTTALEPFRCDINFDVDKEGRFIAIEFVSASVILAKQKK